MQGALCYRLCVGMKLFRYSSWPTYITCIHTYMRTCIHMSTYVYIYIYIHKNIIHNIYIYTTHIHIQYFILPKHHSSCITLKIPLLLGQAILRKRCLRQLPCLRPLSFGASGGFTWTFRGSYMGSFKGPFQGIYRDSIRVYRVLGPTWRFRGS